jgi:DNA polymerase-1
MGKKARSTDKKTLKKMKGIHEVTDFLLDFRSNSKLVDSFVTALPNQIIDGRLHPNFNSVGAVTLRMSCSKPNLQQVPSRVGNLIRNAFIADEGRLLASVDFSGQEVRVLAHVSRCPVLLDIFEHDKDFHAMTGTGIYNKIYGENVTYEYFQYCRGLQDLFLDKDGNIDLSKIDNADELFALGKIPHTDKKLLETEVKKGKAFEKIRKNYAKTVNC